MLTLKTRPLWRSVFPSLFMRNSQHWYVCEHFNKVAGSLCCTWFGHVCLRASHRYCHVFDLQMKMLVRNSCARGQTMSSMTNRAFGLIRLVGLGSALWSHLIVWTLLHVRGAKKVSILLDNVVYYFKTLSSLLVAKLTKYAMTSIYFEKA